MLVKPGQYVLFCVEGGAEHFILDTLIDRDELIVPKDHIVRNRTDGGWSIGRSRSTVNTYLDADYGNQPLLIVRMVDSAKDEYRIPTGYEGRAEVEYLRTQPEIEILVIIAEGKYNNYTNNSRKLKPSDYCKIILKKPKVKKREWLEQYWATPGLLEDALTEYARLHKFPKHENRGILELIRPNHGNKPAKE